MKKFNVLIYVNEEKDPAHVYESELEKVLSVHGVGYKVICEKTETDGSGYDALFVIGGDGTILRRTEYANRYSLPIIGINAGKLGFLSEFEPSEIESAVKAFVSGEMEKDCRATLEVVYDGKKKNGQ